MGLCHLSVAVTKVGETASKPSRQLHEFWICNNPPPPLRDFVIEILFIILRRFCGRDT